MDSSDGCPTDPNTVNAADCTDTDGDSMMNSADPCPADPTNAC